MKGAEAGNAPSAPLRLLGLGLSAMLVPLGSTMIAVALPSIGSEFARTPGDLTPWLVSSYLMIGIVGQGPGGKMGDRWGYWNSLRAGQWIFGAGCLLSIFFHLFAAVVASRVLMALGGALMVPTVMAVFRISVPPERRHRIFGYFGAMMGFAAALGPSLGGYLVPHFGWRSIFFMNLPPLVLSMILSRGFFRRDSTAALRSRPDSGVSYDWIGTALMTGGLVALVVALKGRLPLLAPAAALLAGFLWWEKRTPAPLLDLRLFSHRSFAAGCTMVGLQNLGMYAMLLQLPYLLKLLYQWGPERSGPFMTTFMISMMAASALGGRLAEKVGARAACIAGSLVSGSGMLWLSILSPGEARFHILAGLVLAGTGLGLANGPSQSAAMGAVETRQSGIASGILSTCRYLGGVLGISILGLLLATTGSSPSLSQYHSAILVLAGAFGLATVVAMFLPGRSESEPASPLLEAAR